MEGKYADEGAHADHEIKVPDPPTTDEDDSDPESSDDIFTALRKRSAKVEFSFQKALSKMNQGSSLRDMATPTPRSACWDYFRAAEKGFRELNAELQELSALHTSLAVPIPLELQKYLARCPYELAYTIYYLGAINTARYAETQPLIYEARSRLMTLRDTVEELQAEKLSSLVLRAEENADNERRSRTMNAGSALTPLGGKADEDAADASSSLLSGPLRPIRSERRPDSASSSSSSRSSASSMSSGASSRQHSPPSASSKATKSEVSRSLLSPELPEDSNPSTSRSSSLLSPELPEDAPPPSNALTKLRQQSSSSSSALTRSSGAETERAEKSVNEKDFVGKASHSSFMPMSNEELLKYIAERLETLDSLEAVIVAGIADRDDFVQEQYRARRQKGLSGAITAQGDDSDEPQGIRERLIEKWECPGGDSTTGTGGGNLVMTKGKLVCACTCGTCHYILPVMLSACTVYWENPGERARKAFAILRKIVANAWKSPANPKFRRVPLGNETFQKKVVSVAGAVELLYGAGFQRVYHATEGRVVCYLSDEKREAPHFNASRVLLECVAGELSANVERWDSRDEVWFVTRAMAALCEVGL